MRRADRLFQLVGLLSYRKVITAKKLAEELEVSERTIYRDIQDLILSGVPIEGEAGIGYRLMKGYHLPPLMFTEEELAALTLGAKMVQAWTDREMARAAQHAITKIETILPDHLKPELDRQDILVPDFGTDPITMEHLALLRKAIKQQYKVRYDYQRADQQQSQRTVQPLGLFYWGQVWTLVAWCELRDAFRHFRLDRMSNICTLAERFKLQPGRQLKDYLERECEQ